MRFEDVIAQRQAQERLQTGGNDDRRAEGRPTEGAVAALKGYVKELLFGAACCECNRMAAVPQAAFAVLQVRKNFHREHDAKFQEEKSEDEKKRQDGKGCGFNAKVLQEGRELTPLKYNSKLMNSIWGLYNRYSVHNFKKIDANEAAALSGAAWGALAPEAAAKAATEAGPVAAHIIAGH